MFSDEPFVQPDRARRDDNPRTTKLTRNRFAQADERLLE
jgi:hypothetical protein